mgnify:CR=1 FL=1
MRVMGGRRESNESDDMRVMMTEEPTIMRKMKYQEQFKFLLYMLQ